MVPFPWNDSVYIQKQWKQIKELLTKENYIKLGHTYQVNLSQCFSRSCNLDSFALYKMLAHINPVDFGAYFRFKDSKHGAGLYQGVMSDEVPKAVVTQNNEGYDLVNYSQIDVDFHQIYE